MASKTMRTARKVEKPRPLKVAESAVKLQPVTNEMVLSPVDKSPIVTNDNVLENLKCLHVSISNGNLTEHTYALIGHVCNQLKDSGSFLELTARDQLDKYFVTLRNTSRDERIAMHIRIRLLEIIELRAMGWKSNDNIISYYEQRIVSAEQQSPNYVLSNVRVPSTLMSSMSTSAVPTSIFQPPNLMTSASQASLAPGEIIKNSGKFIKPTKIPGKNFFKDEILIRNSDSGKVSPGARDRLVQITGPHEDNISRAKGLIEDTIRRNASPVRDTPELGSLGGLVTSGSCTSLNSSASEDSIPAQQVSLQYQPPQKHFAQSAPHLVQQHHQVPYSSVPQLPIAHQPPSKKNPLAHSLSMGNNTLGEYSYTIGAGPNAIKVSGSQADLVRTAKLVLEEYFAGQAELSHNLAAGDISAATHLSRNVSAVHRQSTLDSENGSGSLSNGNVGTSSSEEETYKAEGSPPQRVSDLPLDSPQIQTDSYVPVYPRRAHSLTETTHSDSSIQVESSGNLMRNSVSVVKQPLFPGSKQEDFKKAENVGELVRNRREMFGRSSSQRESSSIERSLERQASLEGKRSETSGQVLNSYNFLLDCASSQVCKILPKELKNISADIASIIVLESPRNYFDPVSYQALNNARYPLQKSSSTGQEESWQV